MGKEGKNGNLVLGRIKYNSNFFDNLSFSQQVFVMAHETCHIAFKHLDLFVIMMGLILKLQ